MYHRAKRLIRMFLVAEMMVTSCTHDKTSQGLNGLDASTSDAPDVLDGAAASPVDAAGFAFEPASVPTYVSKVKNLLLGLPPSDADIATVTADPAQFAALVSTWTQQPQYRQKMQRFFQLAFQQTQISTADFADQFYPQQIDINGSTTPLLVQNAQESFARTMLALLDAGRPLTVGVTTHQLMLTTALKELYAFLDVWEVDDTGKVTDRFKQANPNLTITAETAAGPIALGDTLDPTSSNYMHRCDPDVATAGSSVTGCTQDPGALAIDSKSGVRVASGDIRAVDTLASFGKTMLAAVGVDAGVIASQIASGQVVQAALA